jgi:hypothetical protein
MLKRPLRAFGAVTVSQNLVGIARSSSSADALLLPPPAVVELTCVFCCRLADLFTQDLHPARRFNSDAALLKRRADYELILR